MLYHYSIQESIYDYGGDHLKNYHGVLQFPCIENEEHYKELLKELQKLYGLNLNRTTVLSSEVASVFSASLVLYLCSFALLAGAYISKNWNDVWFGVAGLVISPVPIFCILTDKLEKKEP